MEGNLNADMMKSAKSLQEALLKSHPAFDTSLLTAPLSQSLRNSNDFQTISAEVSKSLAGLYNGKSLSDALAPALRSYFQNMPKAVAADITLMNQQLEVIKKAYGNIDIDFAISSFSQQLKETQKRIAETNLRYLQHVSNTTHIPNKPAEVDVPERFYDVAEPLLPLVEQADNQQSSLVSAAKVAVQQRRKTMQPELIISIISVFLTAIFFFITQVSSEAALKQQLASAQETNRLLKEQVEAQHQQIALLQSLDESFQYLVDLQQTVCEQTGTNAECGDPAPELPESP